MKIKEQLSGLYTSAIEHFTPEEEFKEITVEYLHQSSPISPGTYRMVNDYILLKTIGQGTTGKVRHCINIKNGKDYAIKICSKKKLSKRRNFQSGYDNLRREIELMKYLKHPNIIRLYAVIDDPDSDNIYLIMELMSGGTIADAKLTNRTPEPLAKSYFVGLISAVKYLHSINIIHRDIKPENILVSPTTKTAKFCDFSTAEKLVNGKYLTASAGTPAFIPPELCKEYDTPPLGCPIDIWSLGVTLYCIVYGTYPFTGRTLAEMYENIINKDLSFRTEISISQELKDLLHQMLNKNPLQRISADQIQQHPWLFQG